MNKNFIADYYPVFKDLSDSIEKMPSDKKPEVPSLEPELLSSHQNMESSPPAMLNAEELANLSLKYGFSTFQTVILLIKNTFEGHVYLNCQIRSEALFKQGTILFQAKPEFMILNFYEHFDQYKTGLIQIAGRLISETEEFKINIETLIYTLLVSYVIRFPVSIFSSYDIRSFSESLSSNPKISEQQFSLALLSERSVGEFEYIERVNQIYAEKFKEFGHQLSIKEDMFSHYQKRLALALYPNINTEEELDELMYRKLIEDKLKLNIQGLTGFSPVEPARSETSSAIQRIRNKTKVLYRFVSKNCFEVHTTAIDENSSPELNQFFLAANSIYNEQVALLSEALLQNVRMTLLFSKVLIFRKSQGFVITDFVNLLSSNSLDDELYLSDDIKLLRRDMEARLVNYRIKSFTDYKIKFVMDDDLMEIHEHFLQKQMDFIDEQIRQIQKDIRDILKSKSEVSLLNISKN